MAAIAATQLDPVHLYQRPDGPLTFDSTRTSLSGDAEELKFAKVGGAHTLFETSYLRRSPGFEINDLGYLRQADQQSWNNWFGLSFNHPESGISTIAMELQLVAVLVRGGTADGARRQHERAHPAQQPMVATCRRDSRAAGHHLVRSLRSGRARGSAGLLRLALGGNSRRRPTPHHPVDVGLLHRWGRWP